MQIVLTKPLLSCKKCKNYIARDNRCVLFNYVIPDKPIIPIPIETCRSLPELCGPDGYFFEPKR